MSRRARVLVAMVATFAVTAPIGYAVAGDEATPVSVPVPSQIADPAPQTSAHPNAETYLSPPSPELLGTCRERLADQPDDQLCNTIVLVSEGKLRTGAYTNVEFNRAYDQAMAAEAK
jgi:hypothetical protein